MHTGVLGIQANSNSNRRFKKGCSLESRCVGSSKCRSQTENTQHSERELEINTYIIPSSCIDAVQTADGPAFWICLVSSLIPLSVLLLLSTVTTARYP